MPPHPGRRRGALIILTGRGDDFDVVGGLEAGADDYVIKPARPTVLDARIRAVLRRSADAPVGVRAHRDLRIDTAALAVSLAVLLAVRSVLRDLRDTARRLAAGDLGARSPPQDADELAERWWTSWRPRRTGWRGLPAAVPRDGRQQHRPHQRELLLDRHAPQVLEDPAG